MDRRDALRSGLVMAASGLVGGDEARGANGPRSGQAPSSSGQSAAALAHFFDAEWEWSLERNPTWASLLGDRRWNDRWEDASLDAIERNHQHRVAALERLSAIDRAALSPRDQLNYDLFQRDYAQAIEEHSFHWYLVPLNQRGGIQTADELGDELRFTTARDYEDWTARLRSFPVHMDQTIEVMREGIRQKMLLPRVVMERIPAQIDHQVVTDPTASPFYKPFQRFPESIAKRDQDRLAAAGRDAIDGGLVESFVKFKRFFTGEYLPACFEQVGIWQVPNGLALYAFDVRKFTTTNLTPDQVHKIGLEEVARIETEMEKVRAGADFKGSRDEFFHYLRTDPRFFEKTPDDLLEAYRALAKRVDPKLVKLFRTLPRMPYGVEPIPAEVAPDTTAAYYSQGAADGSRAGTYYVNLYRPEMRPKWEMTALTLHESVPGHHIQIALGMEQTGLPNFRRYGYYNAFGEGWGLYAESLGDEMGLYDDPYSKFGQLTYDMWRAVRLVVDTGIHSMRWTRQQAIDYFMAKAAKAELDVVNEIDRYIAWPGQALAYKIGELKIRELRNRAAAALGTSFDVREFHEVVLREGALPLDILERNVNAWMSQATGG
ncbi:MAG TPA: DUF885 domain-containing protein [Terriglobia bacterium]|nr:DUF885 domain-containing protein [Terriglobia bacterium]